MNKKSKEIIENMSKDDLINSFITVYEDSIKKDLEIERLNKELEKYKYSADELNEIERLNNIIKEADKRIYEYNNIIREVREKLIDLFGIDDKDIINILEILNKGE